MELLQQLNSYVMESLPNTKELINEKSFENYLEIVKNVLQQAGQSKKDNNTPKYYVYLLQYLLIIAKILPQHNEAAEYQNEIEFHQQRLEAVKAEIENAKQEIIQIHKQKQEQQQQQQQVTPPSPIFQQKQVQPQQTPQLPKQIPTTPQQPTPTTPQQPTQSPLVRQNSKQSVKQQEVHSTPSQDEDDKVSTISSVVSASIEEEIKTKQALDSKLSRQISEKDQHKKENQLRKEHKKKKKQLLIQKIDELMENLRGSTGPVIYHAKLNLKLRPLPGVYIEEENVSSEK